MIDDAWVIVIALLCFLLGLLVRGELSRLLRKRDAK
jgi:hypothetical protein